MTGYKTLISLAAGIMLLGGTNPALADLTPDIEAADRIETEASVSIGYRGIGTDDYAGRAREYDSLEPSPTFKAKLFTDKETFHLDLGADYLNEDDYSAEAHLDYSGLMRIDLRSQRMFHNLDHIPYDNGYTSPSLPGSVTPRNLSSTPAEGSRPDAYFGSTTPRAFYTDYNPGDDYGRRIDTNEVKLKVKCPDYPAHVNLSYWRYEKTGEKQQRFASEGSTSAAGSCNSCHMQSKSRDIDRVTEEFKAGIDAHAGFIDVVLEGLLRTFRDREPVPVDYFGSHSGTGRRTAGFYEHDEDPDSSLKELTLKLNTAPSGGFVASTAFTLGNRENESDLTSISPVHAEVDYYRASADATYTPSENWTFNLRYRLLDTDSDNNSVVYDKAPTGTSFTARPVRESMDITRAWYEAVASYRPTRQLTLKAEFRREDIERSNTASASTAFWDLPDEEIVTRVKLGFSSRLLENSALKLSGWLAIQRDDDPAYGTTSEEGQELFLTANYTPSPLWGVTTNINLLKQKNNDHELDGFDLERNKRQQNASLGAWLNPREGLSFDLNYGFFHTAIDQDLLFGVTAPYAIKDDSVDYRQTVQTVTAGVTWQALKDLSCRLEGYLIRSKGDYDPDFSYVANPAGYFPNGANATSLDLEEISKVDIRQNGVRGRIDWKLDKNLTCGVETTFDDYDDKGSDVFDGSVQSYMASLSYTF